MTAELFEISKEGVLLGNIPLWSDTSVSWLSSIPATSESFMRFPLDIERLHVFTQSSNPVRAGARVSTKAIALRVACPCGARARSALLPKVIQPKNSLREWRRSQVELDRLLKCMMTGVAEDSLGNHGARELEQPVPFDIIVVREGFTQLPLR
jgi:hypothetical protein